MTYICVIAHTQAKALSAAWVKAEHLLHVDCELFELPKFPDMIRTCLWDS